MKKGAIIGKRQFILAGLVVALAVAVWLNMNLASKNGGFDIAAEMSSKYLGEAQYVGANEASEPPMSTVNGEVTSDIEAVPTAATPDPLAELRKTRNDTREEAVELLEENINDANTQGADVGDALNRIAKITDSMDKEASIETMLSAKGFASIVVIGENDITVNVAKNELLSNETLQIQDAVTSVSGIGLENIKIVTIK